MTGEVSLGTLQHKLSTYHINHSEDIDDCAYKLLYEAAERNDSNAASGSSAHTKSKTGPAPGTSDSSSHGQGNQDSQQFSTSTSEDDSSSHTQSSDALSSDDDNESQVRQYQVTQFAQKKRIQWGDVDTTAPAMIQGTAMLKEVMQSCGFERVQSGSNQRWATYVCTLCFKCWRRAKWKSSDDKKTRLIVIYQPSEGDILHHDPKCTRASDTWARTFNEVTPGKAITPQGRLYILLLLSAGCKPKIISLSINQQRRKNTDHVCSVFTADITPAMVRNIRSHENKKKRTQASTGHEFMLDRNVGLSEYGQKKSFDLPRYTGVRKLLYELSRAVGDAEHKLLMANLRRHELAEEMFVVDVCTGEDGRILGIVVSNALILTNIEQAIRAFGLNNINVAVDGTYELSKLGWALLTLATHSIEMHEDGILSQKIRPLLYMFATSESTAVFSQLIISFKRLVSELFEYVVDSLDVAAFDQCQAAMKAFTTENKQIKPVLDWTHVIMNVKRVLPKIFNKGAHAALTRLHEDSKAASAASQTAQESDILSDTLSEDSCENLR